MSKIEKQYLPAALFVLSVFVLGVWIGLMLSSDRAAGGSSLEKQVRRWAQEYPADVRNRWAWCWRSSAEEWSTDQKMREDVRLKSVLVLTETERQILKPLDAQISEAVEKEKTPLQERYAAVGSGLKTAEWSPDKDGKTKTADGRQPAAGKGQGTVSRKPNRKPLLKVFGR
jgi:hypothetical protein